MIQPITIDFETHRIEDRPDYPPEPVGVAIKWFDDPAKYYSWGHPGDDAVDRKFGITALTAAWNSGHPLLFHNAKFDLAVATEKLGLPMPHWSRVHDTMFLLFLENPHSKAIDLKQAAEELLNWPPEERDEVAEYIWNNRSELQERFDGPRINRDLKAARLEGVIRKREWVVGPEDAREDGYWREWDEEVYVHRATKKSTGEWLSRCPGDLVAPYAIGDVDRTYALFEHLYPLIVENGMRPAYNRERKVLPIFMENERLGIRVDVEALDRDIKKYKACRRKVDKWLRERLGDPELNIDSDRAFAEALSENGIIDDDKWVLTETGQRSVSKKNLRPDMYNDEEVANAFGYRNRLGTCLKMFMEPWLRQAKRTGGTVHTNWNQTRGGSGGTRTGRPSTSSPNFLNISKEFKEGPASGYNHPVHLDVDRLPLVRKYIAADGPDHVLIGRDFSSQELRILAHFERGELFDAYQENPELDVHAMVGDKMSDLAGIDFERGRVKIVNFQSIYGGGLTALQRELNISHAEAKEFKQFHDQALPGRVILNEEIKRVVNLGQPIRTWGGRCYFPEEPKVVNGRMMDFKYKLINYAIQASAADITKQAMIDWYNHPRRDPRCRFIVQVYDELVLSCPVEIWEEQMEVLKEVMEMPRLDVPMLSDGERGVVWGEMEDVA